MTDRCQQKTEVYARVCGFFRPVQQWNKGKREEYKDRVNYLPESMSQIEPMESQTK